MIRNCLIKFICRSCWIITLSLLMKTIRFKGMLILDADPISSWYSLPVLIGFISVTQASKDNVKLFLIASLKILLLFGRRNETWYVQINTINCHINIITSKGCVYNIFFFICCFSLKLKSQTLRYFLKRFSEAKYMF